ncbi:MAG: hypothetical protein JO305_04070 [Alphaproteobacteria bacterium]|nr:hypothetical protein [Alphaproteobacteria bacterium]
MSGIAPYRVEAYNASKDSDNKIHDDAVARRFGFKGGLVPGVDVYGYLTHMPVARWGRAWLEHGTAECRFFKPVYDGDTATITAEETADGLDLTLESHGEVCATGHAGLSGAAPPPALAEFIEEAPRPQRPPASETSLIPGAWLGMEPFPATPEYAAGVLRDVRETAPLYAEEGLVHPATILRTCNWVLMHNVVLGPWMHVGSTVHNFAAVPVGAVLTVRARITGNYERKGHRFVDLDALVLADGKPAARVAHISIYQPRQVAAA